MEKITHFLAVFLVSLLALPLVSLAADSSAPPAIPLFVYGDVSIDGGPAAVGTVIKIFNAESEVASATTTAVGKYYVDVPAANAGATLTYKVNDIFAISKICANPATTPSDKIDLAILTTLDKPAGLAANAQSTSQIDISWTAVSGAVGYRLYRNDVQIAEQAGVTYSDTGLTAGTSYSYKVKAYNGSVESALSAVVSATTQSPAPSGGGGGGGGGGSGGGGGGGGGGGDSTPPENLETNTPPAEGQVLGEKISNESLSGVVGDVVGDYVAAQKKLLAKLDSKLTKRVAGRILLQVQDKGEAWYVDPLSQVRYYLADGARAYGALRKFGLGITNADLAKIPVGIETRFTDTDTDADGLADKLEEGLGTDPAKTDTDADGVSDYDEVIKNNTNPLGAGKLAYSTALANRLKGRIVLQVQSKGEAWYINPVDGKRYYMKDGDAAYQIMRFLSLGITNADIYKVGIGDL
jgi:uncharacterized membrane protein YgcG